MCDRAVMWARHWAGARVGWAARPASMSDVDGPSGRARTRARTTCALASNGMKYLSSADSMSAPTSLCSAWLVLGGVAFLK